MGIKGFYGYCLREIKDSYKTINIVEEIEKYKCVKRENPIIIINLSTLSYHFNLVRKDLICGYQLNKIKFDFENFLSQLKEAGAELEFVFKRTATDDEDFIRRRLRDYTVGCSIIRTIAKEQEFEKILNGCSVSEFPYNTLVLVALIQSAHKFGPVHGCNSLKGKPTVQQIAIAKEKNAAFIMGLDTYYFMFPGSWKIWCDSRLNMDTMTIQQLDPNVVMDHFELKPEQAPLFASFIGDLRSSKRVNEKVLAHFGTKFLFSNAAKFVRRLNTALPMDNMLHDAIEKIFSTKFDPTIVDDFKNTIKSFEVDETAVCKIDPAVLDIVKNDFVSITEEILLNMPIFINPSFLDMRKKDMKTLNELMMPLIQKTAGILLKNLDDKEPREVLLLADDLGSFEKRKIEAIVPEFEIPSLKILIDGDMSTMEKMRMLSWITDIDLSDFELPVVPEEYVIDLIIFLYLMKHKSLTLFEARCILKTLVDARRRDIPLQCSTEYPTMISERAFRVTFLYLKIYYLLHSCLSSLGMKNLCPEIQFDAVYFQKVFFMNQDDAESKDGSDEDKKESFVDELDENQSQTEIVDEFARIIRL